MRLSKLTQLVSIAALLLAASAITAIEVRAEEPDTFLEGPGDTFHIDKDEPDQDPMYDTDDPVYDEMDDLDHEERQDDGYDRQSFTSPNKRVETFVI